MSDARQQILSDFCSIFQMANRIKFDLDSITRVHLTGIDPFEAGEPKTIRQPYADGEIVFESSPINSVSLTTYCNSVVNITLGRNNMVLAKVGLFSNGQVIINYEWGFNSPESPNRIYQTVPFFDIYGSRPKLQKSKILHLEMDTLHQRKHLRLDVFLNDGPKFMMLFTFNNLFACAMRPTIESILNVHQ